jgi:DNA-3-methyladenine glycosylase II
MSDLTSEIIKAEKELIRLDPVLGKYIKIQAPITYSPRSDYYYSLCSSIISQQVSLAAAAAIFKRFEDITKMKPERVLDLSEEEVKTIGLSRQKLSYLKDLSDHFVDDPKVYNHLNKLSDEEVIEELTAIKGIGVWSAQMFLIFTLVRLDVFAPDDVGLKRAIKQIYGYDEVPNRDRLIEMAETWKPYQTVACWHLWKSLKNAPV